IRGAARSRGGKPIIALRATAKVYRFSRIRPALEEGAGVVTSRGDVHYVVTEYGIADLWGKSVRQRAQALIAIAHPDFRSELHAAAIARRFLLPAQPVPFATRPWSEDRAVTLPTGHELTLHPARPADTARFEDLLQRLDAPAFRAQLFGEGEQAGARLAALTNLDVEHNLTLLATEPGAGEAVGFIAYELDAATRLADVRFAVRPDWQHRGLATALFRRMCEVARARGLAGVRAGVSSSNWTALTLLQQSGLKFRSRLDGDRWTLEARFDEQPAAR
ncbi:MAG: GNAT family N-acetyltransferase, partial [Myxococcales bacterium]